MPHNFSYVLDGVLAGMECPGRFALLREDLAFLHRRGVRAIVSLTEQPLDSALLKEYHFQYLHLPVRDFHAPELSQVRRFMVFLRRAESRGRPVVVHCGAGCGRTGTLLACALVQRGCTADQAIARVRELRPSSVETGQQEQAVRDYEAQVRRKKQDGAQNT